ncbi:MAG TPA: ParB N-terminal domain-containing protein [Micromonosporaceae bacterium]|nr:ParB N-terminal domain-containing protein [Micromonosporaceae bacterium]
MSVRELDQAGSAVPWIESHPIVSVDIDSLVLAESPRSGGADAQHIRLLAEATGDIPPITVHRETMTVIDGTHRVHAAIRNGQSTIAARIVDCDAHTAFVLAVAANISHGLPLSRADRTAAARRIIASHPHWSNRAVAAAAGLSYKTVTRIRTAADPTRPAPVTRGGRDGRARPLNTRRRREQAAAVLRAQPEAPLREIARATGLSPATVHDVRRRIGRGEHPVPERYRDSEPVAEPERPARPVRQLPTRVDGQTLLNQLGNDPAVRLTEAGRHTVRLLHRWLVDHDHLARLSRGLPDHWAPQIAHLARICATAWQNLAEQLHERAA